MRANVPITFTLDLEDHRPHADLPKRFVAVTRTLLDRLAARGVKGTVFVVGELARAEPALVREVAEHGHEIALHSYRHEPLSSEDPIRFGERLQEAKDRIEALCGRSVVGFRAPVFSLTPGTLWAVDTLQRLGFRYSSSVLPAAHPLHGFPGAPRRPFRWPNGLLELPVPVATLGRLVVPFLGGVYLRYLPLWLIGRLRRTQAASQALWTYCHPYDFDPGERNIRIQGASWMVSVILWLNRRGTWQKLEAVLAGAGDEPASAPFHEQVLDGRFESAPHFDPGATPRPAVAGADQTGGRLKTTK